MGFTRYFHTNKTQPRFMTKKEVIAGVKAIEKVANQHQGKVVITLKKKKMIVVDVLSKNPVESLEFRPKKVHKDRYIILFAYCVTNKFQEDEVIQQMLNALQVAVNDKLDISSDDDGAQKVKHQTITRKKAGFYFMKIRRNN